MYIPELADLLKDTDIRLGAQNVSQMENGAYTGEVSSLMLKDFACQYVIVGHSERRNLYGESDELVAEKFEAVIKAGMVPILCVGEQLQERDAEQLWSYLRECYSAVVLIRRCERNFWSNSKCIPYFRFRQAVSFLIRV